MLDHTHDPLATSWVHTDDIDFPIQNLPHGIFRRAGTGEPFRGGVAIGNQVLDLAAVQTLTPNAAEALTAASAPTLNALMALGPAHWTALRHALFAALKTGSPDEPRLRACLVPQAEAEFALPATIGDFTDFYASIHHATILGTMLRPTSPLMPNYKWLPVAYHGRSSSVGISGQQIHRPRGQSRVSEADTPTFGPSARLDYELELGFFVGPGNTLGHPIRMPDAEAHVFGATILNDWSARDIQTWEYQPLGPFLGKNFASTISPWVVTMAALAPFRVPFVRPDGDPAPLPHLAQDPAEAAIDIKLDVALQSAAMRAQGVAPQLLSHSNYRHAYWTVAQMVAHHTSNGCNLRAGDLLGTGTLSGPEPGERGSILEVTMGGREPITLPTGETRRFIEDGDAIIMRAWCTRPGAARIGFGSCTGTILAPIA